MRKAFVETIMQRFVSPVILLGAAIAGIASGAVVATVETQFSDASAVLNASIKEFLEEAALAQPSAQLSIPDIQLPDNVSTYFATFAGGGAPSYNEIALEKNVLYFQRALNERGYSPELAHLFFANGNDGQATVRYLDENNEQQFKSPEIPELDGAATYENMLGWFQSVAQTDKNCPSFFYFTGHGAYNRENEDNNWLILWEEAFVSVQDMAKWLEPLPADQPFVTMMAQCYSGAFANLIYEDGDPSRPVALQTRCGFFATVASRPSVGCTPAVNEADYKDYSSSFFAGLTGRDRIGNTVSSADYDQDEQISYAEAHAFAKVDEATTDWPISTVEAWLQRQATESQATTFFNTPIEELHLIARPEQQYVLASLAEKIGFDLDISYADNYLKAHPPEQNTVKEAYYKRLEMELINVGMESAIRDSGSQEQLSALEKILGCEASTWQ
ncbi:MAG: Caspase domain-containing protein [Cyanobacteria bacterium J06632_3]